MSDTIQTGTAFVTGTSPVSVQGSNCTAITNIQINGVGLNAPAGTTIQITDGSGAFIAQFSLALPGALLAAYFGNVLDLDNLVLPIAYVNSPVTVKLSNALSSGTLAVNIGFTY